MGSFFTIQLFRHTLENTISFLTSSLIKIYILHTGNSIWHFLSWNIKERTVEIQAAESTKYDIHKEIKGSKIRYLKLKRKY